MRFRNILLLLPLLLVAAHAAAQGPTSFKSLHISLWPEFDNAQLLVILDADLSQPGQAVHVPIPANAEINAVAVGGSGGDLVNAAYETINSADVQVITLTPTSTKLRIEYYAPLPSNGAQRTVELALPAGYVVADAASLEALLPASASILHSQPELQARGTGISDGLLFQREVGTVKAATGVTQTITYNNPTNALTAPKDAQSAPAPTSAPAAAPAPKPATTSAPSSSWGIWLLAFLAVVLIAAGLFGVWRTRQPRTADIAPAPTPANRGSARKPTPAAPAADRFCRKCGAEFQRDDRFCRQCGASRR